MKLNIQKIINSTRGKYVISVLLGLGLATLFRKACTNQNCLVFKAPAMNEIKGKIFQFDNKCYTYQEKHASCDKTKKIVKFE